MISATSKALAADARRELLENILPFWRQHTVDQKHGGFLGELSNDAKPNVAAGKGLILNARILWTFSAAWRLTRSTEDAALARRAYEYLDSHFHDPALGGYYWELDVEGEALNRNKKVYGQAFAIYALTEYYRSFGDAAALGSATNLFHLIEKFARDPVHGGYLETMTPNWRPSEDMRLSEKDPNEKKSMNNHLHILEAYTNLLRVWPDPLVRQRLRELLGIFSRHVIDPTKTYFNLFFDEAWKPRSDTNSFGHNIEGSWLLCEAASVLGDESLWDSARAMAIQLAHGVLAQGVDHDGGVVYEARYGHVVRAQKEWWPQAEAVVGFLNARQLTHEHSFLDAAVKCWRFIQDKIVDHSHGEWFWAVSHDGVPNTTLPKVSMWKCPYHNGRACLEVIHRIEGAQVSKP